MTDVRDLMLGNIVQWGGDTVHHADTYRVIELHTEAAILATRNKTRTAVRYPALVGIPITPKWLEKLGFEWLDKKHGVLEKGLFTAYTKATSKTRGCVFEAYFIPGDAFCVARFEVEYVHDLQNLMHSTTKAAIKLEDWE